MERNTSPNWDRPTGEESERIEAIRSAIERRWRHYGDMFQIPPPVLDQVNINRQLLAVFDAVGLPPPPTGNDVA